MHSLSIGDRVFHKTLPVCWTDLIPKDFLIYKICKSFLCLVSWEWLTVVYFTHVNRPINSEIVVITSGRVFTWNSELWTNSNIFCLYNRLIGKMQKLLYSWLTGVRRGCFCSIRSIVYYLIYVICATISY